MGLITILGPLGLISGRGLGGALVDVLGWPWIFCVNVPVSVLVAAVALCTLPRGGPLRLPDRTWLSESLLLGAAVAALLLSVAFAASWGPVWVLLALVGVPLLLLWLRMPGSGAFRELLRAPGEAGPRLAVASSAAAIGTVFFIAPYFMQRQLGGSVSAAGVTGCGNGLFNAPNMALAMARTPRPVLATAGASTSLARQIGMALAPAPATLAWSASSYGRAGDRWAMALAAVLSALSVAAPVRTPVPAQAAPGQDQRAADGSLT